MEKNYITFLLNSNTIKIPSDFNNLIDVNQDIYHILVTQHKYEVKSNVSDQIFQSFIDHWVNNRNPEINVNNISEYELLSQEFDRMQDIIELYYKHLPSNIVSSLIIYNQDLYQHIKKKRDQLKANKDEFQKIISSFFTSEKVTDPSSNFKEIKRELFRLSNRADSETFSLFLQNKVEQNGYSFILNSKEKTAGLYSNYNKNREANILIPTTIKIDSITYTITRLFQKAFNLIRVKSIQFQEDSKLETIDRNSFSHSSFEHITIPSRVTRIEERTFSEMNDLISVNFQPNSELKYIGKNVFDQSSINELTLPSCVEEFCEGWCYSTPNLNKINVIQSGRQNIKLFEGKILLGKSNLKSDTFDVLLFAPRDSQTVIIPPSVEIISPDAFHLCSKLETVIFSHDSKLRTICKGAFANSSLNSLKLPSSVSGLKEGWCSGTYCLNDIEIERSSEVNISLLDGKYIVGKSHQNNNDDVFDVILFASRDVKFAKIQSYITKIDSFAFNRCSKMKGIEFDTDSKLTTLEKSSFLNSSIVFITIPQKVTSICENCFAYCSKLQTVSFHDDSKLRCIGDRAFHCSGIKSLKIPKNVTFVGDKAFNYCFGLNMVVFDDKSELTIIGEDAFSFSGIKFLSVPQNVTTIKKYAFAFCQNLQIIDLGNCKNLYYIDKGIFKGTDLALIMVPSNMNIRF